MATFFVALNFKTKTIQYNEKNKFKNNQEKIIKGFRGKYNSIHTDELYNVIFLEDLLLYIQKFQSDYTFVSKKLKRQTKSTYNLINNICLNEIKKDKKDKKLKLCKYLTKLISFIEKEEPLL